MVLPCSWWCHDHPDGIVAEVDDPQEIVRMLCLNKETLLVDSLIVELRSARPNTNTVGAFARPKLVITQFSMTNLGVSGQREL